MPRGAKAPRRLAAVRMCKVHRLIADVRASVEAHCTQNAYTSAKRCSDSTSPTSVCIECAHEHCVMLQLDVTDVCADTQGAQKVHTSAEKKE